MKPFLTKNNEILAVYEEVVTTVYGCAVVDITERFFYTASCSAVILDGYTIPLETYQQEWAQEARKLNKIFKLYVVRTRDSASLICGLDILKNGNIWVGLKGEGDKFSTMREALAFIEENEKTPVYISLEEAFPI